VVTRFVNAGEALRNPIWDPSTPAADRTKVTVAYHGQGRNLTLRENRPAPKPFLAELWSGVWLILSGLASNGLAHERNGLYIVTDALCVVLYRLVLQVQE